MRLEINFLDDLIRCQSDTYGKTGLFVSCGSLISCFGRDVTVFQFTVRRTSIVLKQKIIFLSWWDNATIVAY